ncbi:cytochrome P450 [Mycena olivaceomarginata]|nr:cytochrome P450 [Mycena olivaceomarginata]
MCLLWKARKLATCLGTQVTEEKAAALEGGMDPGNDLYVYLLRQNTTLTKEDIVNQTSVLLIAGQDTMESLRMFPAEALAERIVVRDTVIPLTESISTMAGEHIDYIPVRKGEVVLVGIASYQRDKSRWGENPDKFDPLWWVNGRVIQGEVIGIYANLVMEMQTIFSELLGKFSFALEEDKPDDLFVQLAVTLQPSDPDGKKVVPLRVTRLF